MQTIEKTIYKFDELDDSAKDKARDWYRSSVFTESHEWEFCFDDAVTCAAILGIEIDTRTWTNPSGFSGSEPKIYFSGFCSQGDGASFVGNYRYMKGAAKAIRQHAPDDKTLHTIADTLQAIQKRNFYRLRASITQSGPYYHAYTMRIETEDCENEYRDLRGDDQAIDACMRDFADWIYSQLENEYDYQSSDEAIDEAITANEYEFNEDGSCY